MKIKSDSHRLDRYALCIALINFRSTQQGEQGCIKRCPAVVATWPKLNIQSVPETWYATSGTPYSWGSAGSQKLQLFSIFGNRPERASDGIPTSNLFNGVLLMLQ